MTERPTDRRLLLPLVFIAGMVSLGVEFGASRLLAPFFGTSLYVWGLLIGLILLYLSAGYVLGGRIADRFPSSAVLYQLTAVSALWIGLIPLAAQPILILSQRGFATLSAGLVLGTLIAVVGLFAVPVTLLGCVSPYAIRLLVTDVGSSGRTAGSLYALSTAGSILGTFLPVFWFIPSFGTRLTFIGFSLALLAISVAGLWPRRRIYAVLGVLVLVGWVALPPTIKPPAVGRLLFEKESAYHYIQVVQEGSRTELILNEGQAIHSIYDSERLTTGGPWDYFLVASAFQPAHPTDTVPTDIAIIGLAGGTAARQYANAYGSQVKITGVEIDPDVLSAGYAYFHLGDAHARAVVQDGRYWLATDTGHYDVIVMDAYRQPYIPFHLTTREFFQLVHDHLRPDGVAVVNAGRTATDYRLVEAVASTMRAVFPSVYLVDVPAFSNTIVFGSMKPVTVEDIQHNLALPTEPLVRQVADSTLTEGKLRMSPYHSQVFTDELAPVERLIDQIILGYVSSGG